MTISCAQPVFGQFETASVLGYVRDNSGAPIAKAGVELLNLATGVKIERTTDDDGRFEFVGVPAAQYKVTATAPGFNRTESKAFMVNVNSRQRVDLTAAVGQVTESVTVSGAAAQLESETSQSGGVISATEVHNLPLNGRAYGDLATLVPGVRRNNLENQSVTSRDASFNVNGQRSEFNNFLLDGLDNNAYGTSNQGFSNQAIPPSPDAINEFNVETSNYSAEFGRASGAVINVSINSGGNKLHGRVWEYNRNTAFNALGPFPPAKSVLTGKSQIPVLIRNQFGGAIGGPIIRNKLFYFADYEGNRQVQGQYTTATVPNANQRQGIFVYAGNTTATTALAGQPVPLVNPLTGVAYTNGTVPQAMWTPLAKLVIAALPAPNVTTSFSNNYVSFPKASLTDNKGDGRIDYYMTSKTTMFGRFSNHHGDIVDASSIPGTAGGGGNGTIHVYNKQLAAGITHSFTPSQALDARIGLTWTTGGKSPYLVGQQSLNVQAGITGLPTDPIVVRALSSENVNNFTSWGAQGSNPQFQNPFVIDPKVNYSLVWGKQSIKAGWEFMSINTEIDDFNPVYGSENFSGAFSQNGAGTSDTGASQAAYLADFLVGARSSYQLNNFVIVNYRQLMNFFYVQDDFKATPKLTINAGLRYELATPQFTDGDHIANYDPVNQKLIQASSGSLYNRALVNMPMLDFAPRFGVAYQLTPKTVVRSAFGMSYQQFNREGGENLLAYNGPYIVNSSVNQYAPFGLQSQHQQICTTGQARTSCFSPVDQGYPSNFVSPSAFSTLLSQTRYIPKDIPTGYVEAWHLDVQREVAPNTVLTVSYIGEHGVHIWALADLNQANPCPATGACGTLQARRPITTFTGIEESIPAGFLKYHALQAKLEHRFTQGFYLLNSFTYSRGIDNASGHLDTPNNDNSRVNLANLRGESGQSAYNQPLNDTLTLVWDLPFGRGRRWGSGISNGVNLLLGDWQLNAINTATSGQPVNLVYNISSSATVSSLLSYRPNVSGDPKNPSSSRVKTATALTGYLSTANVSVPSASTPYGNAGRNSFRGEAFNQLDMGLHKQVRLWSESSQIDIRGEAFNLLNHVNYAAPDSNRSNGSFGNITSAFPARQLQVGAKIIF
jgi:TonB-dependent Receptor Plug Domain.